jgi:hypothetical protein
MELMIDNPTYTIIFFLLIICLSLVPYSANKQLDQPILVYGGVFFINNSSIVFSCLFRNYAF